MLDQIKLSDISSFLTIIVMFIIGMLQLGKYRAEAKAQTATAAEKITNSAVALADERKTMFDEIKVQLEEARNARRRVMKRVIKLEEQLKTEAGERFRENKSCREVIAELDQAKKSLENSNMQLQARVEELARRLSSYIGKEKNESALGGTAGDDDLSDDRDTSPC